MSRSSVLGLPKVVPGNYADEQWPAIRMAATGMTIAVGKTPRVTDRTMIKSPAGDPPAAVGQQGEESTSPPPARPTAATATTPVGGTRPPTNPRSGAPSP